MIFHLTHAVKNLEIATYKFNVFLEILLYGLVYIQNNFLLKEVFQRA